MPAPRFSRSLAAAALAAALSPPLAALPAAAAPSQPCASLTASASADLVRVDALDLRPLGLPANSPLRRPGVGLRVASTRATMSTNPAHTAATARGVEAALGNNTLTEPAPVAAQQAPPLPSGSGTQVASRAVDLGVARVGTGNLRAKAGWQDGYRCAAVSGQTATSSVGLVDAAVLPGRGGTSLVRAPRNLSSATDLGLAVQAGRAATTANAQVGLAELRLFDGTAGAVQVRVVSEPTLSVSASVRSSVRYTSPVLDVRLPNGVTRRLDAPGARLDLAVSGTGTGVGALPVLSGNPLAVAYGALGSGSSGSAGPVVLRLSVGTVAKQVTGGSVRAEAVTLRVQLLAGAGSGATLLDIGLGVLSATATAPQDPAGQGSGGGGSLPLTGVNVGWLLGIGVLLAIGGRLLLILARRHTRRS
jgi:hypothetical protein